MNYTHNLVILKWFLLYGGTTAIGGSAEHLSAP